MKNVAGAAAIVVAIGFGGLAQAGGLPEVSMKDDPVIYHSPTVWTGFYVGGFAGYGWSDAVFLDGLFEGEDVEEKPFDLDGEVFGFQVGYDVQQGNIILGLVGDYSWIDSDDSYEFGNGNQERVAKLESIWTARGRVGYLFHNVLVYGTAGYAGVDAEVQRTKKDQKPAKSEDFTTWVFGVGTEAQIGHGFSVFAEYLRVGLDDEIVGAAGFDEGPVVFEEIDMVKVGVNFKIGHDRMESMK